MTEDLELVERLERATAEAREATREAHSATKALRQAERDVRGLLKAVHGDVHAVVNDQIKDHLTVAVEQLAAMVEDTRDKVMRKAEELVTWKVNMLLYGNEKGRGTSILDRIGILLAEGEQALRGMTHTLPHLPPQMPPVPSFEKNRDEATDE